MNRSTGMRRERKNCSSALKKEKPQFSVSLRQPVSLDGLKRPMI
jgi:hypothetical protein